MWFGKELDRLLWQTNISSPLRRKLLTERPKDSLKVMGNLNWIELNASISRIFYVAGVITLFTKKKKKKFPFSWGQFRQMQINFQFMERHKPLFFFFSPPTYRQLRNSAKILHACKVFGWVQKTTVHSKEDFLVILLSFLMPQSN